jgi:hypothetical protein
MYVSSHSPFSLPIGRTAFKPEPGVTTGRKKPVVVYYPVDDKDPQKREEWQANSEREAFVRQWDTVLLPSREGLRQRLWYVPIEDGCGLLCRERILRAGV